MKFTHPVYYKRGASIKFWSWSCGLFVSMSVSITNIMSYKLWWGNHIVVIAELIHLTNLLQDLVTFSYNYILWSTAVHLVLKFFKVVWLSNYSFTFDLEQDLICFFFNILKFWICDPCVFPMDWLVTMLTMFLGKS